MERVIITSAVNTDVITLPEVDTLFNNKGLIILYDNRGQVVGSVIYCDGTYILGLMKVTDSFNSLKEIMEKYPNFTFKYIT